MWTCFLQQRRLCHVAKSGPKVKRAAITLRKKYIYTGAVIPFLCVSMFFAEALLSDMSDQRDHCLGSP